MTITLTQNNLPLLDRKEWQMMTPVPVTTATAMFVVADEFTNVAMYVASSTVQYLYHHDEDGFVQINSAALAGTFGAGACGALQSWSITYTANGGTTSTVQVAAATHNLVGDIIGQTIEFLSANANIGIRATITQILTDAGSGNITLTVNTVLPAAVVNGNTFRIMSGRFYVMGAGTIAAGIFKTFDVGTLAWQASLSTTNLAATWGTDGRMVSTSDENITVDYGLATSGGASILTDTTKTFTTNQYTNYFISIIGGTGVGQTRVISSNTTTVITVSLAWTTPPDLTSHYEIVNNRSYSNGITSSATPTTIVDNTKTWTVNQWTNFQVRITGGTGIGQVRPIASNTATALTVSGWTTQPDTTSTYIISGNEDNIYLFGNGVITSYKYSISGNTWAVMAPTVVRAGAASTGMSADWISKTLDSGWANESAIKDGRFIFSFRGGAVTALDRFDISGGVAGAGTWLAVVYPATETFASGSSTFTSERYIFMRKDATNRFFKFSVRGNYLEPVSTNLFTDGTALVGNKLWVKDFDPTQSIRWLYSLQNTGTALHRLMLF